MAEGLKMKCQKCAKPAEVHLTEIVSGEAPGSKQAMETHLCLGHAIEAGLVIPSSDVPPQVLAVQGPDAGKSSKKPQPSAIIPASAVNAGLAVVRGSNTPDPVQCPICGMSWSQFKQAGLMGCPHDYELFSTRMIALVKRAQEGATEHLGKMPPRRSTIEAERQVTTLRLRRELQRAIDSEKYEEAAQLRDQLRNLEQN
jgi:protein arginine kinase activator